MPYAIDTQLYLWLFASGTNNCVTDVYLWTKEHNDLMFFYLG